MNETTEQQYGALIQLTPEQLADLLGIRGDIAQIIQDSKTGAISIVLLGDKEHYPALTEKSELHVLKPVWLKEVKCDRALKLIHEDGTTYIHREVKK